MNTTQKDQAREIEGELCMLGGALRGLGMAMGTIAEERDELSVSFTHDEDMGYLVLVLSRYAERLATDLDAVLAKVAP